jgi:hypothetical protein
MSDLLAGGGAGDDRFFKVVDIRSQSYYVSYVVLFVLLFSFFVSSVVESQSRSAWPQEKAVVSKHSSYIIYSFPINIIILLNNRLYQTK